jgi:hypothetical protein
MGLALRHDDVRQEKVDLLVCGEFLQGRVCIDRRDDTVTGALEREREGVSQRLAVA